MRKKNKNLHFLLAIPTLILILDSRAWWRRAVNLIEILQLSYALQTLEMVLFVIGAGR